jgi:hypothetical protein
MPLEFCGAETSVHTRAELHSFDHTVPITYDDGAGAGYTLHFENQILYGNRSGHDWQQSTEGMDSGALVLTHDLRAPHGRC